MVQCNHTGMAELTLGSHLLQQGVLRHASQCLQRLTGVLLSAKRAVKQPLVISCCCPHLNCSGCVLNHLQGDLMLLADISPELSTCDTCVQCLEGLPHTWPG